MFVTSENTFKGLKVQSEFSHDAQKFQFSWSFYLAIIRVWLMVPNINMCVVDEAWISGIKYADYQKLVTEIVWV